MKGHAEAVTPKCAVGTVQTLVSTSVDRFDRGQTERVGGLMLHVTVSDGGEIVARQGEDCLAYFDHSFLPQT
jgi:hypothetical protein